LGRFKIDFCANRLNNPKFIQCNELPLKHCKSSNLLLKALFTIPEVHEDIYLVVRVEKCLDGTSLHSSLQPYLNPINDGSTKVKTAIKLNKKMQQLLKTKLANYRQPFAWAAKYDFFFF